MVVLRSRLLLYVLILFFGGGDDGFGAFSTVTVPLHYYCCFGCATCISSRPLSLPPSPLFFFFRDPGYTARMETMVNLALREDAAASDRLQAMFQVEGVFARTPMPC